MNIISTLHHLLSDPAANLVVTTVVSLYLAHKSPPLKKSYDSDHFLIAGKLHQKKSRNPYSHTRLFLYSRIDVYRSHNISSRCNLCAPKSLERDPPGTSFSHILHPPSLYPRTTLKDHINSTRR